MATKVKQTIFIPSSFAIDGKILDNPVLQLRDAEEHGEADISEIRVGRTPAVLVSRGGIETLVLPKRPAQLPSHDRILLAKSGDYVGDAERFRAQELPLRWLRPEPIPPTALDLTTAQERCEAAVKTWEGRFKMLECRVVGGVETPGLRPPQVGALYASLAHWKVSHEPATIVMPTGTGKTETMLALLVHEEMPRLLVVVPTNALREQTAWKFITLGLLKTLGIVAPDAQHPVVTILKHRPKSVDEVDEIFLRNNVIVTTMNVLGGSEEVVQRRISAVVSHVFIDEAHHIAAPTWNSFRRVVSDKPVLQFTATPFRRDGRHVDGRVIFNYPLKKAQEEGYFTKIKYRPVTEYAPAAADEAIATEALIQLREDLTAGFDHIVMARVEGIPRAEDVQKLYATLDASLNPLLIHSQLGDPERRAAMAALVERRTRVIVCVDMLGEGFDLPELKIAALHDAHKSLAVTLQFTGRFTRVKPGLGTATMIANNASRPMEASLRDLYAEDADWNHLIQTLSAGATTRHTRRTEFLGDFVDPLTTIPLQNIFPKMSALVYRTKCVNWEPERIWDVESEESVHAGPTINHKQRVLIFVTRETEAVPWGKIKEVQNVEWHLYMVHWNKDLNLLFINTSNTGGNHEALARAIAGKDVELIRGEFVFRILQGINRLILMNLGLSHTINRAVRFSMHVGSDIGPHLGEAHTANKVKSNLFGAGYAEGEKVTVGCSQKGRIWSYKIAYDIPDWLDWCRDMGRKLLDDTISTKIIFQNIITPTVIEKRPEVHPLVIDWPEELILRGEQFVHLDVDGEAVSLYDASIELVNPSENGPLVFRVVGPTRFAEYRIELSKDHVDYLPVGAARVTIRAGKANRPLTEWFQNDPPVIYFADGSFLRYNELCTLTRLSGQQPFATDRIVAWDWTGIDLKKESQTHQRFPDSIQARVISELVSGRFGRDYDIVFDDDDSGEIADVIGVRMDGDALQVDLFHCKFSKEAVPGARVKDLYEVCGQAQKCIFWRGEVEQLLGRLPMRDESRRRRHGVSRFEKGDLKMLQAIRNRQPLLRPEFRIFVVQPGLSRSAAERGQLELLGATELYLKETFLLDLGVIGSS